MNTAMEEGIQESKSNTKTENDADILEKVLFHVGDMGLYQKLMFLGMLPCGFFLSWVYFVQMFITVTPDHWCNVPELAGLSVELRRNLSTPMSADGQLERCMTYDTNWALVLETLTPPPVGTPLVSCPHGWEFEFSDIPYETVVSERGWVCNSDSNVPTAQSIFFVGSLTGAIILGWMADKFGRVPAFMCANLIGAIGGIGTIFTNDVWDFILCRFLVGMAYDNCFMMYYILVLEYVGPKHRTWIGALSFALFFGGGCILLPWMALWIGDWRTLLWVTSLPLLSVLVGPWLIPESTRWLISQGKVTRAVKILRKFETVNRTKIPEDVMKQFMESANKTEAEEKESVLVLFKSPLLRRAIIAMVVVYMCCATVFDGLVRLSESLGMNFFIAFTFSSATEIPSLILLAFLLDRLGRRLLTAGPLASSSILIFIALFVPKGIPEASLAIAARFFMNMSFTTLVLWTAEILPTAFRASGSSALHMSGYIAAIMSPFIVYSERAWSLLPLVILTILAAIGGGFSLMLPETKGLPMPQTVADGEKLIREQSLCGKPEDDGAGPYNKS